MICPLSLVVQLAVDLRPSVDGSAVRTSLVAGQLQAASVPIPRQLHLASSLGWDRRTDGSRREAHTHTHPFNGPFSGVTRVSRYQKGKTNLDFTEARDSEWQWHQLDHMQVCISLQTDNHASTPPLVFYRPYALPVAQPTASKH